MIIDDNKLEEMVKNEIKLQVSNKINKISNKQITKIIEDVTYVIFDQFANEMKDKMIDAYKEFIIGDKDYFREKIIDGIKQDIVVRMIDGLESNKYYD